MIQRVKSSPQKSIGSVRIISGLHKGRKLPVLNKEGLRPTTDRVKETLFNWLMFDIRDSLCLDLFAGSGSLGFEAYSRGAKNVTMCELEKETYNSLLNCKKLLGNPSNLDIKNCDSLKFLKTNSVKYDVIFLDPPFRMDILQEVFPLLTEFATHKDTLVYVEQEIENELITPPSSFELYKEGKAGQVCYKLYKVNM